MRLFQCLMKKILPGGNIWGGRHRLEYIPSARTQDRVRHRLEIEEENMLYLRHPYLTVEQSKGHMARVDKWAISLDRIKKRKQANWFKSVRLEDKLNHLRHAESWEK